MAALQNLRNFALMYEKNFSIGMLKHSHTPPPTSSSLINLYPLSHRGLLLMGWQLQVRYKTKGMEQGPGNLRSGREQTWLTGLGGAPLVCLSSEHRQAGGVTKPERQSAVGKAQAVPRLSLERSPEQAPSLPSTPLSQGAP